MPILAAYEKRLERELREIYDLLSLDFYDIEAYPKEQRTTRLELMRRAAIRQEVVTKYTLIDEYLASELCVHFFGTEKNFPADVERLNALRSGVAHAFFPENLKRSRAVWKGKSIFSLDGLKAFHADMLEAVQFFQGIRGAATSRSTI